MTNNATQKKLGLQHEKEEQATTINENNVIKMMKREDKQQMYSENCKDNMTIP